MSGSAATRTSAVVVLDRAVRHRRSLPEGGTVLAVATDLRRRGGWWAGIVDGGSPEGLAARLRRRDVCVVAADAAGRGVVWIDDVVQLGVGDASAAAESIVPGCGPLWARGSAPKSTRRAWTALRRAHARALVARQAGLPPPLWRRLMSDDPAVAQRAAREWLAGEEALAVHLVHSAVAVRVARGEAGYRVAGLRKAGASRVPASVGGTQAG